MHSISTVWRCCPIILLLACGGAETSVTPTVEATQDSANQLAALGYPTKMLSGPGEGPALFLHDTADSPALGYLSAGVPMKLGSLPSGGRVLVKIGGKIKVRAWLPVDRLALRVQKRGRVSGTPTYVGPGDLLVVRGPSDAETLRVTVLPNFEAEDVQAYDGTFPRASLNAEPTDPDAKPLNPGTAGRLPKGKSVDLYNKPDGNVVATIKGTTEGARVSVLKESGEWKGVRAGRGPYLVGYIKETVQPFQEQMLPKSNIPERLQADASAKLWRLKNGARIRFEGKTVGIVSSESAMAREINRYPESNEVDVFVASDDDLAIRGMVAEADLIPTGIEIPAAADSPAVAPPKEPAAPEVPATPETAEAPTADQ